jgi:oxaloacetate decarboxylase (Na+ extruding) subunit alpha
VSPFAQFLVTQAVLNVMNKTRYAVVPDEVRRYVRGGYGAIAGFIDPDLYDRITGGAEAIDVRPGELVAPAVERLRRERGPFASDDDLLLAAFYGEAEYGALKHAGPIATDYPLGRTPLLTLVSELAARDSIRSFHFIHKAG